MSKVKLKVLDDRINQYLPQYQTPGSAGIDLRACVSDSTVISPNQTILISTGISIYLENPSTVGVIVPRSGLGHKNGIVLGNLVGIIDSDYQGPLMVSLWNRSNTAFTINPMDRIAQYLIVPVIQATFEIVDSFDQSERGEGGFGSTGKA